MAQGKQTPRQKMINLMYLVFIAMMALNMSKEVLTAFGMINEDFTESNEATTQRNTMFMADLGQKATEQPKKYVPLKQDAEKIDQMSDELYTYIENLKSGSLKDIEDPTNYESMDRADYFNHLFYESGVMTETGQEFVNKINTYRTNLVGLIGEKYPKIAASVEEKFSTGGEDGKVVANDKTKREWLNYHYVGFPLIASLTKMTQLQANIKSTQSEILSAMLGKRLVAEASLSNYKAIVIPEKTAFFSGEPFKGKVILGRFDETTTFEKVIVNGQEVKNFSKGQVVLEFPAGNVGQQEIKGNILYKEGGEIDSIAIESAYTVIPRPNEAVISADKMNVVYRGVNNPMTISVPGATNVSASAPGLRQTSGNSYTLNPTNIKAREVSINVTAKLPGGDSFSSSKKFRIKEIPRPSGTVRGQMMEGAPLSMNKQGLSISTVSAKIPNFDFDLGLRISGFKLKVEGERTITVSGQKLNAAAQRMVQSAKRGSTVTIFDIQAKISGNSSYRLPSPSPVIIELKN